MLKVISIVGARPQFIKAACVSRAIKEFNGGGCGGARRGIRETLLHTGQHYDYNMNDVFFEELKLPKPDYNLCVGSGSHGAQTGVMLERIEAVLNKEAPDLALVYGDTNSTLAGALAAKKLRILTAHIEAGLRSFNMDMPEEINRVLVDRIADVLFCPSRTAVKNLSAEGIKDSAGGKFPKVFLVGDVMYDSVLLYLNIARKKSNALKRLNLAPRSYYLATIHRAENTDDAGRISSALRMLDEVAARKATVVFPVHPRTKKVLKALKFRPRSESLRMIEPLSYIDMLALEENSKAILTDSGGVQKEAFFLGVPCVTLREETEWVETVEAGLNVVAGGDSKRVRMALENIDEFDAERRGAYPAPSRGGGSYGDGKASAKIVRTISDILIRCQR